MLQCCVFLLCLGRVQRLLTFNLDATSFLFRDLTDLSMPGNSLLPLRCLLPFLQAMLLLIISKVNAISGLSEHKVNRVSIPILAGIGVAWSNDYGVACLLSLVCFSCWRLSQQPNKFSLLSYLGHAVELIASASTVAFVTVSILTKNNFLDWFRYNYIGVLGDQSWYFEATHMLMWSDFPLDIPLMLALVVYTIYAYLTLQGRLKLDYSSQIFLFLQTACFFAGSTSIMGGHWGHRYYSPFMLTSFSAFFAVTHSVWVSIGKKRPGLGVFFQSSTLRDCVILYLFFTIVQSTYSNTDDEDKKPADWIFVEELGGFLPPSMTSTVATGRVLRSELMLKRPKERIFSTYSSAINVLGQAPQASRADYIIHALGQHERKKYLEEFRRRAPKYVTTFRADWTVWESWVQNVNWWWYKPMRKNYRPAFKDQTHIYWTPRNSLQTAELPKFTCRLGRRSAAEVEILLERLPDEMTSSSISLCRLVSLKFRQTVGRAFPVFPLLGPGKSLVRVTVDRPDTERYREIRPSYNSFNQPSQTGNYEIPAVVCSGGLTRIHLSLMPALGAQICVDECEAEDIDDGVDPTDRVSLFIP